MASQPEWTDRLVDMLLDPVCAVDREGRVVFANAAYQALLGYSADELRGRRMMDLIHPDDRAATEATARAIMAGVPARHFRNRYLRRDGGVVHLMWSARWCEADGVRVGVARDMTPFAREEAMKSLAAELAQAGLDASPLVEGWQRIRSALQRHLGIPAVAAGIRAGSHSHVLTGGGVADDVLARIVGTCSDAAETFVASDDGRWMLLPLPCGRHEGTLALAWPTLPPVAIDDEVLAFVANQVGAVIRAKLLEEELAAAALHDALTGLPNRRLLIDRTEQVLGRADREGTAPVLLFLDLDGFKLINDRLGHAAGDAVLAHTARVLVGQVRETDTVARIGGDEFAILIDGNATDDDVDAIADAITTALREPIDYPLPLPAPVASIGSARYPQDGRSLAELLDSADRRMYGAKARRAGAMRGRPQA